MKREENKSSDKNSSADSKYSQNINIGICAVPISKKLPFMSFRNIPIEYVKDIEQGKTPQNRYYIAKFLKWEKS